MGLHDIPHDLDRVDRAFGEAVRNLRDWSTPIDVAQLLGVGEVGLHACSRQGFLNFFETWSDLTDGFELNKFSVSVGWADRLIEAGGGLIGAVLDGQHEGDLQHAEPMSLVRMQQALTEEEPEAVELMAEQVVMEIKEM